MKRLIQILVLAFVSVLAYLAAGQPQAPLRVRMNWWPPQTGSVPVAYRLQVQDPRPVADFDTTFVVAHQGGDERIEQEFVFLDGEFWAHYRARVQAVDVQGRIGPWSPWSAVVVFEISPPEP